MDRESLINNAMITPKESAKNFGSGYSDYMDDELPIPETDGKNRKIGCYICIIICVLFWATVFYLIF
jgi:hypothetical protein